MDFPSKKETFVLRHFGLRDKLGMFTAVIKGIQLQ